MHWSSGEPLELKLEKRIDKQTIKYQVNRIRATITEKVHFQFRHYYELVKPFRQNHNFSTEESTDEEDYPASPIEWLPEYRKQRIECYKKMDIEVSFKKFSAKLVRKF